MSTRVLPVCGFPSYFSRMSDLRRRLQVPVPEQNQEPTAEQSVQRRTVGRNLFGPIDHEENLKFVHEELSKISQADNSRWNFDFKKEQPTEGRYAWEVAEQGKVPVAYEMPNLTAKLTLPNPLPTTSKITNVTSSINQSSSLSSTIEMSLKSVSSATTTILTAKPRLSTAILSIPSLNENIISPVTFVDSGRISQVLSKSSIIRPSTVKQPKITEFLKIGKRTHSSIEEKHESEEAPPALKRARTSS